MIKIEAVDINQPEPLFDLVEKLLDELREEGEESAYLDRDHIQREWSQDPQRLAVFIARNEDNQPVAVITLVECFAFYAGGNFGIINELYVEPEYRSQKVGQQLLETAKEHGRKKGWKRIDVTTPPGDRWRRTIRFYEREGFVFTGPKLKFKIA